MFNGEGEGRDACMLLNSKELTRSRTASANMNEGLRGVLGNKGTLAKYRREQGNISQFLGTGEKNFEKLQYENILRECGNMGT